MINNGIVTTVKINKKYFGIGETFQIRLGENRFVNGTVIEVTDDHVIFSYYDVCQKVEDRITFYTAQIAGKTNTHSIVRLKPDYKDGCMIDN